MRYVQQRARGVTLLEILISIAIMMLISSVVLGAFGEYRLHQSLAGSVEGVLALFSEAHLDTISSKNDSIYGVNIKPNEVIYFKGEAYPGDNDPSNIHYVLPVTIEIADISLAGGDSKVYFKRLSGGTDNLGTFKVRAISNVGLNTVITVYQTGVTSF